MKKNLYPDTVQHQRAVLKAAMRDIIIMSQFDDGAKRAREIAKKAYEETRL